MSDDLDQFLRRKQMEGQGTTRTLVEASATVSPDEAARRAQYRRTYGLDAPQDTKPIQLHESLREAQDAVLRAPGMADWLAKDKNHAALSRGAMANLADIHSAVGTAGAGRERSFLERAKDMLLSTAGMSLGMSNGKKSAAIKRDLTLDNIVTSFKGGIADIGSGAVGAVRALAEMPTLADRASEALGFSVQRETPVTDYLVRQQEGWEKLGEALTPKTETSEGSAINSAVRSLPLSVGALLGGAFTGSASIAAGLMGATVGGQSYGRGRAYGLSPDQSLLYGAVDASIETVTERLPILKALDVGAPFSRRFANTLVAEGIGEQIATFGQDLNSFINIEANRGKTFGDFLAERPEAAYQTAIASTLTAGAMTATISGVEYGVNKVGRTLARASYTDDTRRFVESLSGLAKANGVLQRDRGSFEDFVREAAEGTDATDVFVEAEQLQLVLNQSGVTVDEAFDMTGLTPEQLQEAVDRGEDVSIAVEQFAARIAPTPVGDGLLDHLRLDPEHMSPAQAKVYLQGVKEELAAAAEQGAVQSEQQQERQASRAAVEGAILADLQTARRFTSDVNETYASLVGAFFDTQSAKLGITAEEMFKRFPLRVQSGEVAQPTFDQAQGDPFDNIEGLLDRDDWAVMTAENPNAQQLTPEENEARNEQLRARLREMGLSFREVRGKYGNEENSIAISGITREQAMALGNEFEQESVLTRDGLVYGDGTVNPATGVERVGEEQEDFFSTLDDGTRFAVGINFDRRVPVDQQGTFDPADPNIYNQSAVALQRLPMGVTGTGPGGRVRNWDLGEALTLQHMAQYGRALDPTDPADYQTALLDMIEDYLDQKAQPDNGEAWYSDDIAEAIRLTEAILPEIADPVRRDIFLTAVALLSPQQGPIDNWSNAIDAMVGYSKTGRFALTKENGLQFGVKSHETGLRLFEHLMNQYGEIGALVWLNSEHTGAEMEELRRSSGIYKNKADNYLPAETNKRESKLGVYIFGPKVGDFMLNSAGLDQSAVTVDLWMARTYNRLIGRLTDVNERQRLEGGLADAMRGRGERAIVKQLVRDAAADQGIAPSAMQAALWYFEQRLYRNHGIQSESTSFSDAAREAAKRRGIAVPPQGGAQRSAEDARRDLEEGVRVYNQDGLDPLDAFRRESFYPTVAVRHADDVVYADVPAFYPERLQTIADKIGAQSVVAVPAGDPRLEEGVPLWYTRPPVNADGTITLQHFGPEGLTQTDPSRWGESNSLPKSERAQIGTAPDRTYFGIASGQPGGYRIEFQGRNQYEARVPAERLYDMDAAPMSEADVKAAGYLGYWSNNSQLGLVATIFEPLPVTPAKANVFHQDAVFFSALERTLEKTATNKASAQQWKATLEKTPGIKEDELNWTGLLDFLSMVDGPVSREQILELVRGAGLRVDEVVLGWSAPITKIDDQWLVEFGPEGMVQGFFDEEEARAFARQHAKPTQFANWSSDPQNETYRELLITLPIGEGRNPNRAPSTHWDTDGVIAHARFMDKTDADGKRVLFIEEVQSDWHQKGRDQGYAQAVPQEQIDAAAVASNEAYHAFIESKARLASIINVIHNLGPQDAWDSSGSGRDLSRAAKDLIFGEEADVARTDEQHRELTAAEQAMTAAELRMVETRTALRNMTSETGIPNAPFRTDWPALVMKRMIRYAAEHGYERIAWTTGEQQAERYNLSQATGPLSIARREQGDFFVRAENERANGMLIENGLAQRQGSASLSDWIIMSEAQISEAFGRDVAGKLIEGIDERGRNTLEGDDLRVGGEGMKAFYDRNLVNITNKLVKKYGAKVGAVNIRTAPEEAELAEATKRVEVGGRLVRNTERVIAEGNLGVNTPEMMAASLRRYQEMQAEDEARLARAQEAGSAQPGFDITPALADAAMGGFPLFQRTGGPRGQIAMTDQLTESTITLLRGADLSTFVHELGHFFFEVANHLASQAGAPATIVADRDAMLRYLGVESASEWENRTPAQRREGHERMARSFEAFLFEGRAPSLELRALFGRLRNWMVAVYRTITRLDVELTDEVRGAFTRMLASDEAIAEAEADQELRPLFQTKPEGMSESDWEEYQQLDQDARTEAAVQLESRSLRDMRFAGRAVAKEIKRLQREVADQRAVVREEVEAELSQTPVYSAIAELKSKDGTKLNTGILKELMDLGDAPLPDALRGMTSQDGLHPQQVAELFGFTSADHMVTELLFASPLNDAVEAETDQRMRERYGDLNTPEEVEQAARAAVHNEVRGRFVATELAALQNAPGKKRVLAAAAKRLAEDMIARLRIRDLRPGQYEAAERRAAKAAQAAGTTDIDELVRQKRNQLFQFNAAKAAHEARDEMRKAREYLTKFGVKGTRAALDVDYLDQIDQLLERYELRQISNREADRRKNLFDWIEQQRALGFEPAIDPQTLAEIGRKNWRDLTVEEMRGLLEAVKNIEFLARWTKQLLTAKDKADLDTVAAEMGLSVRSNATRTVELPVGAKTWYESVRSGVADFFAMHRKIANMVHVFDGNQYGGVFWERFIRPMNERGDWQATRTRQANEQLAALFTPISRDDLVTRRYEPAIQRSISLEDRIMVALNMGNEANLQRLMSGDRWEYEQVLAVVAPLEAKHWDFVESVWRHLDSYRPEIAAKERRVTGVEPQWVEAVPFQIEVGGELRLLSGGYFPIKYDPDKNSKANADEAAEVLKQMTRGLYTNAQTRRGHTKARVDEVNNRPLRKTFGVIFGHVNQVIHDLAWHEYLIDANRLLKHGAVDSAIREHYGPETLRWMSKALEDIAIGDIPAQNAFEKSVRHLRTGVSIAAMGWSIWTSLLQPTGLTQSMSRIGSRWVIKGIGDWLGNPVKANEKLAWVREQSAFMRERGDTMQREISEIRNRIGAKSPLRGAIGKIVPEGVNAVVADSYFYMIAKAQLIADMPTWLGQYEKSMAAGEQHDRAVAIADQAVIDSQGAGQTKDLAGIQRGSELMKLFTNFYSYFSATFNLMADRTTQMRRIGASDLPYYAIDMMLLSVVPATIASLMYAGLKGGDDDEPEDLLKQVAQDNGVYMLGLMVGVREIGSALAGVAGYTGPAGARFFSETGRFGKQVAQGEVDEPLLRAGNSMAGILFHYPATQIDRTVRGSIQYAEGEAGPQAILVGPPAQ